MELLVRRLNMRSTKKNLFGKVESGICNPEPWPRTDSILHEIDGEEELTDLGKTCLYPLLRQRQLNSQADLLVGLISVFYLCRMVILDFKGRSLGYVYYLLLWC